MLSVAKIKYIHSLKVKKYRKKYSHFIAEGRKVIKELTDEGSDLKELYLLDAAAGQWEPSFHKKAIIVTAREMKKISNLTHPGEALAVFAIPEAKNNLLLRNEWIIALDELQDPGNMGTIIRTADWFGIKTILCSEGCVDAYSPKVVQASMASIGRVRIAEVNLEDFFRQHQEVPVYGAVLNGKNYLKQDYSSKGILLIGNEGHGIRTELSAWIRHAITIPRKGKAESLNAAIALSLICARISE